MRKRLFLTSKKKGRANLGNSQKITLRAIIRATIRAAKEVCSVSESDLARRDPRARRAKQVAAKLDLVAKLAMKWANCNNSKQLQPKGCFVYKAGHQQATDQFYGCFFSGFFSTPDPFLYQINFKHMWFNCGIKIVGIYMYIA